MTPEQPDDPGRDDPTDTAVFLDDEVEQLLGRVNAILAAIQAEAESLAVRVSALERLRDALSDYLAGLVAYPRTQFARTDQRTHFALIAELLAAYPDGLTLSEMEKGLGIRKASLSAVVYRTHAKEFVSERRPGRREKVWKLREGAP